MKRKIRRRCGCKDCGLITNPGRKYINGHYWKNKKRGPHSKEAKLKMSLAKMGNTNASGKKSEEHILNSSLGNLKLHPNDEYCDIWRDKEYKKDIRKNYCENANCKGKSKKLDNHHIYLDKKRCSPDDVMTLCASCHKSLHLLLLCQRNHIPTANSKDYIIINRPDHVSYINKELILIIKDHSFSAL